MVYSTKMDLECSWRKGTENRCSFTAHLQNVLMNGTGEAMDAEYMRPERQLGRHAAPVWQALSCLRFQQSCPKTA